MLYYSHSALLKKDFCYRLTFWSRHSTKVRKDINSAPHSEKGIENEEKPDESNQKTKLQLAVEAAEFLYESKKLKM